ncbi:hypothetical protein SAY87_020445 [Trapa incisa]|uniref:Uncharacterized protein n=1 Tax=Trapa incisa TaxID=236973 RepID=A0AAN7K3Y8_9MYRT|nr:hypothetical protein SAY87_020445 [Trapa incisa]
MGFFDLNIPYDDSASNKVNRIKLATKAMELGYDGVAYSRTMNGVMSDRDRCSINHLSLSSLLKVAPSLSSSVSFHRDLLGVPRSSPFRQYTRLTVSAESVSQAQALNSGNPILKSYDLVAIRPLNQIAFDYACERSEVDIIALDFSEKLHFRLKQHMIKAAIVRGIYFEITYSSLLMDIHIRRQMISKAKLLVDWTRGRNLIVSSAAATVTEIRGPYDIANLLSLFGLSMEHAKASISRNCRTLIASSLRKKQFYKETIRLEPLTSMGKEGGDDLWSLDWDGWDPISSGSGDLCLKDSEKVVLTLEEAPKVVKAINFESLIENMPSLGFQINNLIPQTETALPTPKDDSNLVGSSANVDVSVETKLTSSRFKTSSFDISLPLKSTRDEVSDEPILVMETMDAKEETFQANSIVELLVPSEAIHIEDDQIHDDYSEDEFLRLDVSDTSARLEKTDLIGMESGKPVLAGDNLDVFMQHEHKGALMDTVMRDVDFTNCQFNEECSHYESPVQTEDGLSTKTDGNLQNSKDSSERNRTALRLDANSSLYAALICDDVPSQGKAIWENQIGTGLLSNSLSAVSHNEMKITRSRVPADNDSSTGQVKITTNSSIIHELPPDVGSENQKLGAENTTPSYFIPSLPITGSPKVLKPLPVVPFPFKKRSWGLLISKKLGHRCRRRN